MKTSPDPIRFEEYTIEKNEFGYYEVTNKPSEAELNKLYSQELLQDCSLYKLLIIKSIPHCLIRTDYGSGDYLQYEENS